MAKPTHNLDLREMASHVANTLGGQEGAASGTFYGGNEVAPEVVRGECQEARGDV